MHSSLHQNSFQSQSFVRNKRLQKNTYRGLTTVAATSKGIDGRDLAFLKEAAELSASSVGLTAPHPNAACILVTPDGRKISSAYQRASGSPSAEVQAVEAAQGATAGTTAYVNLETGDCHGEDAAVRSLIQSRVSRVVVGLRHPLSHARGTAISAFRKAGITVDVLNEVPCLASPDDARKVWLAQLQANEALLHRAAKKKPMSILKYAMTLDGKIATQQGHSAWVTSPPARALVFDARAKSDAVIVGGNTVRRDNPRLTTRRETGHIPVRIVMSRTLDLPEDAALWDVSVAPTIVTTQRGARTAFQARLRARGVEVVEFDFLTPAAVADYCYSRGFLQCFWECGGILAAPCISNNVIHKLMAFIAPKVIGGARAPTPVGELGFVEMTQAVSVSDYEWQQVGPDLLLTGYLPSSGGLEALAAELEEVTSELQPEIASAVLPNSSSSSTESVVAAATSEASQTGRSQTSETSTAMKAAGSDTQTSANASTSKAATAVAPATAAGVSSRPQSASGSQCTGKVVPFYKAWDRWGSLSNFSPHPITLPHFHGQLQRDSLLLSQDIASSLSTSSLDEELPAPQANSLAQTDRQPRTWPTVEHFYQAQKFAGSALPEAATLVDEIACAGSPEEAARIGRRAERANPQLLTPGWSRVKVYVMLAALRAKFSAHPGPRSMLLTTRPSSGAAARLVEASPNDFFWGAGYNGNGRNMLGQLLAQVRTELEANN